MKISLKKYSPPNPSQLLRHGLGDNQKIIHAASFDILRLHEFKTSTEIAAFFDLHVSFIYKIIEMQKYDLELEEVFPERFINREMSIFTGNSWEQLKQTDLYKHLTEAKISPKTITITFINDFGSNISYGRKPKTK